MVHIVVFEIGRISFMCTAECFAHIPDFRNDSALLILGCDRFILGVDLLGVVATGRSGTPIDFQ